MSKERELLNKAIELIQIVPMMASIGKVPPDFGSELILEIQELLAQHEQEGVYQKLLRIEDGIEIEILPSDLWQDGYETGKRTMQPEQEQEVYAKGYAEAMQQQVYEAFEAGRKSALSKDWDKERDAMSEAWYLPESKQEPVAFQYRTKPDWKEQWSTWEDCRKGTYEDYNRVPLLHNWAYETRELYTSPPIEKSISKQDPLSDSRVIQNYTESTGYGLYLEGWKSKMLDFARAIEKAHGIGVDDEH